MSYQVELRQFRRAKVIAELRSVNRAAEKLHITQPALTVDMKKFQDALCVRLFLVSSGNRMRLTRAAQALSGLVQEIEETIEDCTEVLVALQNDDISLLRFGCGSFVDLDLFQTACDIYQEAIPDSAIMPMEADAATLVAKVAAGELDAAIVTKPITDRRLCVEEIHQDRFVVCLRADDPLAMKPKIMSTDLQNKLLILYHPEQHPDAYVRLMELLQDAYMPTKQIARASSPEKMQALVKSRFGFALVREGSVRDLELTTRPIMGFEWTVDTALIYNKARHPRTVGMFLRLLRNRVGSQPRRRRLVDLAQAAVASSALPPSPVTLSGQGPLQLPLFKEPVNLRSPGFPQTAA